MISILIPVYNRDVVNLVLSLAAQVKISNVIAEIIVMDDGSDPARKILNNILIDMPGVEYLEAVSNMGRIRTRQCLAEQASYEWLLFLDCDSIIVSEQFLETYFKQLGEYNKVIFGGRIYASQKPADCKLMLHWKYGSHREITSFDNQHHTNRFMTNNFLISKGIFNQFDFSEGWAGYGYEDSWMSIQLEAMNVTVQFINNPVLHDGVENFADFLSKTEVALCNLKRLSERIPPAMLAKYVKLYDYYYKIRSWKLLWLISFGYYLSKAFIHKNLRSCNPSLKIFDFYRLHYFVKLCTTKTTRA